MKRLYFIAIALMAAALGYAAEPTDTVAIIKNPTTVTVTADDGFLSIKTQDSATGTVYTYSSQASPDQQEGSWDINLPFVNKRKHRQGETIWLRGLYWGYVTDTQSDYGLTHGWECGLMDFVGYQWWTSMKTSFSVGMGLHWTQMRVGKGMALTRDLDRTLRLTQAQADWTDCKGQINMYSVVIPVTFTQRLSHSFGFSLSAIANLNYYTTAKTEYQIGNLKYTEKYKGLEQRILTADFMATVGWSNAFGIFAKFSPCQPFRSGYGPRFKRWSFGISLAF